MIFEVFNQNSKYYREMMDIILEAKNNPPEKGQVHHIVPRCWFKHYNMDVDNSISNTVLLSFEDHKKVHTLAYKCAKEKWFKSKMACAAHWMGDKEIKYIITEDMKKKISESKKGDKNPQYGKIPWNKGKKFSEEIKKKMSESHKRENLSEDTIQKYRENAIKNKPRLGTKTSEEARKNMSNALNEYYKNEENRLKCGRKFKGKTWIKINGKRVWRNK
jgi:hypothetical protein